MRKGLTFALVFLLVPVSIVLLKGIVVFSKRSFFIVCPYGQM